MSARYWIILAILGAAFGTSFALNEVLLGVYGPLTVSALRVGLGALGCWVWIWTTRCKARMAWPVLVGLAVFGVFQYAAPFAFLPFAQQHITSSAAGIANALTPVAVVIVSHFWAGGERATTAKSIGIALGVAGVAVLATQGAAAGGSDPRFVALAVAAPFCYAIALNLVRRFGEIDPVVLTAWATTGGALAIAPVAMSVEGVPGLPGVGAAAALAALGFGLTTVAFLAMYSILPRVGATNLSLVTLVAPISATAIGALMLSESVGFGHVAGMGLILCGLVAIDGRVARMLPAIHRPVQL